MRQTKGTTRRAMLLAGLGAPAATAAVASGAEPAEARRTDDAGNALMQGHRAHPRLPRVDPVLSCVA